MDTYSTAKLDAKFATMTDGFRRIREMIEGIEKRLDVLEKKEAAVITLKEIGKEGECEDDDGNLIINVSPETHTTLRLADIIQRIPPEILKRIKTEGRSKDFDAEINAVLPAKLKGKINELICRNFSTELADGGNYIVIPGSIKENRFTNGGALRVNIITEGVTPNCLIALNK